MLQLLWVADQIDCDDSAVAVFDGHRTDRSIILAHDEAREARSPKPASPQARKPVDCGGAGSDRGKRRILASNVGKEARNPLRPADRIERRGAFSAFIRIQYGIIGQNLSKG